MIVRRTAFLLALVVAASASDITEEELLPDPHLLGGVVRSFGDFPAAAFIVTPGREICGAAVVDERHVVTLAQCVLNGTYHTINPRLLRVNAGDIRIIPVSHTRQSRLGLAVYVHPHFKSHSLENDIAVIRLQEPFHLPSNEVEPAFRRTRIVPNNHPCHLVGWGQITTTGTTIDYNQRSIPQTVNDRDQCTNLRRIRPIFESMICAGNLVAAPTGPAPCNGNLGSGLYCDGDLAGLLSYGLNCGLANNPPTFTQIRFFNPWIQQQLTRTDIPPHGWSPLDFAVNNP
ncbi:serine protease 1-like [Uranotaenia lowii]|uniref:serine protease 1-like n=1 Tax=Uranotaenia lowii TaxID=190385 RepID=UPI0024798F30|nr:serine protease 1-like [Uranotaenia lowii]